MTNDANGNLTAYNGNSYSWDVRNRLVAMTGPGLTASFDYDFADRRADKNINTTPRTFRWDGDDLVNDCSGLHTRWTLQSSITDEPLAQYDSYYPDGLYMTPDHLGCDFPKLWLSRTFGEA